MMTLSILALICWTLATGYAMGSVHASERARMRRLRKMPKLPIPGDRTYWP